MSNLESKAADQKGGAAATPEIQDVFVLIDENHDVHLFFDAAGTRPMTNSTPLYVLGDPKGGRVGKVRFNFIADPTPGPHGNVIETADLVIIAQTVTLVNDPHQTKKGSPFIPANLPVYFLPDPAPASDPGNIKGTLPGTNGVIPSPTLLRVRSDGEYGPTYKYSVIALCDGRKFAVLEDPTVIIKDN